MGLQENFMGLCKSLLAACTKSERQFSVFMGFAPSRGARRVLNESEDIVAVWLNGFIFRRATYFRRRNAVVARYLQRVADSSLLMSSDAYVQSDGEVFHELEVGARGVGALGAIVEAGEEEELRGEEAIDL